MTIRYASSNDFDRIFEIEKRVFSNPWSKESIKKELDNYSTREQLLHQGYVAEVEHLESYPLKEFIKQNKKNLNFVCLDEVTDPRNIGSLIRSAASFNLDGLIVKERSFPSESKLMYKAASGSLEYLNIFKAVSYTHLRAHET